MVLEVQIEIDASPKDVRSVFLDFENFSEIGGDVIRSISRLPSNNGGEVESGELLDVDFSGMKTQIKVLKNTPEEFVWRGDLYYVLSGIHSWLFKPSTTNPGWTTFISSEIPLRLNIILMPMIPARSMMEQFMKAFKARVESVKSTASSSGSQAVSRSGEGEGGEGGAAPHTGA